MTHKGLSRGVHHQDHALVSMVLRTPVIADDLYINGEGYQGLCADSASQAFEVSHDSADNLPPLDMASNDRLPDCTVV
jgi:hypothetical protein